MASFAATMSANGAASSARSARSARALPARLVSAPTRRSTVALRTGATRQIAAARSTTLEVVAAAKDAKSTPTVADTKRAFIEAYSKPINPLYNTVIQEFMVLHHLGRYNTAYKYDAIMALGFVSVFDQVCDGISEGEREKIFKAYIEALDESPETYRSDAEKLTEIASSSSAGDLKPDASGNDLQKAMASVADNKDYYYTKWFGIGLFRMLELAGATEPQVLEGLVSSLGVKADKVSSDLMMYKSVLSKMSAAKELMAEMMAREKKKQAERDAEKAAAAEKSESEATTTA